MTDINTPVIAIDFDRIAARYLEAWNERQSPARLAAVSALWADDGRYSDPLAAAQGHAEIDAVIAAVQGQFPDFSFRLTGPVDGHHRQVRFGWELGPVGADAPIAGFDVATLDPAGRIREVLGFLDRVPTPA